ncbi:MAG TPA: flagellin [Candidatus Acidoferrum sp.]|nr:flagellin [Candidatus Acidoferrum sp.]
MPFGILNNISALQAEGALESTQNSLSTTLQQLSTGQRINSGSDDPAGLAIANGLSANIAALNQSIQNANDGVGNLQVADGALSQVTSLLNTAVTIATEASTGTVSSSQRGSLDAEYQQILQEITQIGSTTDYNGTAVFNGATTSIYLTDGTNASPITTTISALTTAGLGLSTGGVNTNLLTAASAQTALTAIGAAVQTVANDRGSIGASVNRLQDASSVMTTEVQNLTAAENNIMAADIPSAISQLSNLSVLSQTGMAALAQANSQQQSILKLLQ